jgi:uncharacterized protein (TIGR02118 family)
MAYYLDKQMPMSIQLLSAHSGFKGVSVERGRSGVELGSTAAFAAMCHFVFDSLENFVPAFTPNAARLQGDIPNYTDVQPVIRMNDVLISARSLRSHCLFAVLFFVKLLQIQQPGSA